MVEIDPINNIRYRLRMKDAREPNNLPGSELSSRLKLKEGKHHLALVVERPRKKIVFPAPPGEHSNYEKLFDTTTELQQAVAYLTLTLEPRLDLTSPVKGQIKQGHKSLSIVGDIGEEAWKKRARARREAGLERLEPIKVIEVDLKFGLDVTI
ncbi:Hypothetical protein PENO1_102820 [Penicillium occitanis (nom. inval.)]|nr:Hypothetical protein PENO1_102820 [Penicillium occitanis (nom. inval.)]PCH03792.1 hypothetical protein PENOC_036640 [Penicillium occitanis (nom. inval.)]